MRLIYKKLNAGLLGAALLSLFSPSISEAQVVTQTLSFTGGVQSFTVPACVGTLSVDLRGARGGFGWSAIHRPGYGGRVTGVFTVTPGQVLNVYVGGVGGNGSTGAGGAAGYNGGGQGALYSGSYAGGGGGGATDIRVSPFALGNRLIVAAGGGGSAFNYGTTDYDRGGDGGTTTGEGGFSGGVVLNSGYPGAGGTQTAGGTAGNYPGYCAASPGALGVGGNGGTCTNSGGGGGGGYYGGGAGVWSGGGGGSNYVDPMFTNVVQTRGAQNGAGQVVISYVIGVITTISTNYTAACAGSPITLGSSGLTTYTWSNGATTPSITVSPTSPTSYSLNGTTSNGCPATANININVSAGIPTLAVTSSTNQTCLGKTVTLTATGALTYTWTNGVTNGVAFSPTSTATYTVLGQNGCGTTSAVTSVTVAPLQVGINVTPTLTCAGGGATLTSTSGGTSFTWSPNGAGTASTVVAPTVSTVYTVAVSDGTCFGSAVVSLSVNPIPTISIATSASVACQGGVVTMTASGGVGYTWTPGNLTGSTVTLTPNQPTLYQVIGDNTVNCTAMAQQVVVTNPSPTITIAASDNLICNGGSSTLTASGANTYTWLNTNANTSGITVNPTSTTIYSVTGLTTGNNCPSTKTVQIAVFTPTSAVSGQTAICIGSSATLTASGADSYTWDNGAPIPVIVVNPQVTTMYTVTALTATGNINCSSTNTIQVTVNPNPTVSVVPTNTFMCAKESNTLTASGATSYSWNTTATTPAIVVTSSVATTINYSVTGTDANGCTNVKFYQLKVNGCTGINEANNANIGFVVYPNPNNGNFALESDSDVQLRITNELGQLIKIIQLNDSNNHKADVKGLSSGLYFISGDQVKTKIVVE